MKLPRTFLIFAPLVILPIFFVKSIISDTPSTQQIAEFEKKFELIKVGMTKKEVKELLGETSYRIKSEQGKAMEEISVWAYTRYGDSEGNVKPAIFFDLGTDKVKASAYTTQINTE
jgi:hypothetical protein